MRVRPRPLAGSALALLLIAVTLTAPLGQASTSAVAGGPGGSSPQNDASTTTITNGGFESAAPNGWSTSGTLEADSTESGGHSGNHRLSHYSSAAYKVETRQRLGGLSNGPHTLHAWVRSGGDRNASWIGLTGCGGAERRTYLPVTSDWVRLAVSTHVTGGHCTISLGSDAGAGGWADFDDVTFSPGVAALAIKGADTSSLPKSEAFGGRYYNESGGSVDPLAHLRANGVNYIRLKVWVNPADGYNNKARVLALAKRVKALGMRLLVDFHYSDAWADPGKQYKPAAWRSSSFAQLRQAVYDHTYDVLNALKNQGTTADMVQIGNETNDGMLWEDGRSGNFANLAALLTSGVDASRAVSSSTLVALHLAEAGNSSLFRWWFDNAVSRGVRFDVIAASYYPFWHGNFAAMQSNLTDMANRYGKRVIVAETAYPFTTANDDNLGNLIGSAEPYPGYPATADGQARMLRDVMSIVQAVPNALGVFYWEPTWTAVTGSGWDPADPSSGNAWENQALFGFNDRSLPAIREFARQ